MLSLRHWLCHCPALKYQCESFYGVWIPVPGLWENIQNLFRKKSGPLSSQQARQGSGRRMPEHVADTKLPKFTILRGRVTKEPCDTCKQTCQRTLSHSWIREQWIKKVEKYWCCIIKIICLYYIYCNHYKKIMKTL